MELIQVCSEYARLLSCYLSTNRRIEARVVQKLDHLLHYAVDSRMDGYVHYCQKELQKGFESFAMRLLSKKYSSASTWQDFVLREFEYNSKLQKLKAHIQYVDEKDQLWKILKYCLMKNMSEQFSSLFYEVCNYYVFTSRSCEPELLQIYQSIYDYEVEVKFEGCTKMAKQNGALAQKDDKILATIKKWITDSEGGKSFIEIYTVWKNYLNLSELTNSQRNKLSGMQFCFEENPYLLLRSLQNVILTPNVLRAMYNYKDDSKWKENFIEEFYRMRDTSWKGDFEHTLQIVFTSDRFGHSRENMLANGMRDNFQRSVKDVNQFQTSLLNYLDTKFQKNYYTLRKVPSKLITNAETYWVKALITFIIYYLPGRQKFLDLYLRKGLFRQMVMLGGRFSFFYNHSACLERFFIEGSCKIIPKDMRSIQVALESALESLTKSKRILNGTTVIDKIYLSSETAEDLSLCSVKPIWPSNAFKEYWARESRNFSDNGKILHGAFKRHIITMKLPINLPNGKPLILITNLSIASILYLYNSYEVIAMSKIRQELNIEEEQESLFVDSFKKLLGQGLIAKTQSGLYAFNYNFNSGLNTLNTGLIKVI